MWPGTLPPPVCTAAWPIRGPGESPEVILTAQPASAPKLQLLPPLPLGASGIDATVAVRFSWQEGPSEPPSGNTRRWSKHQPPASERGAGRNQTSAANTASGFSSGGLGTRVPIASSRGGGRGMGHKGREGRALGARRPAPHHHHHHRHPCTHPPPCSARTRAALTGDQQPAWRSELVISSDRKHRSAFHPHGHQAEHGAGRVRGGPGPGST